MQETKICSILARKSYERSRKDMLWILGERNAAVEISVFSVSVCVYFGLYVCKKIAEKHNK